MCIFSRLIQVLLLIFPSFKLQPVKAKQGAVIATLCIPALVSSWYSLLDAEVVAGVPGGHGALARGGALGTARPEHQVAKA